MSGAKLGGNVTVEQSILATYTSHLGSGLRQPILHQWTVNATTYALVRDSLTAAVIAPIGRRRSDLLAHLFMVREGDLFAFYEADPHLQLQGFEWRRGVKGVYRAMSAAYHGPDPLRAATGYEALGLCPGCGQAVSGLPRGDESATCPDFTCGYVLPRVPVTQGGGVSDRSVLVLPWRVDLEALDVKWAPVSDERLYTDWEIAPGLIWVGSGDNQSARTDRPGAGSSARQLTPEEGWVLGRLLDSEPYQQPEPAIGSMPYTGLKHRSLLNPDGSNVLESGVQPKWGGWVLSTEHDLNLHMATQHDDATSSFTKALGYDQEIEMVEYAAPFYPWGARGGHFDFVVALRGAGGRRRLIIVEAKRKEITDRTGDGAVIQLAMYLPWAVKRLAGYASCADPLLVTPVVLGRRVGVTTGQNQQGNIAGLAGFRDTFNLPCGTVNVEFEPMQFVEYEPLGVALGPPARCSSLRFTNHGSGAFGALVAWRPDHGLPGTKAERQWIRENPWSKARLRVGLPA